MYSTFFIGVLYVQHILHYDPIRTGLAFLPQTLAVAAVSSGFTARIMGRIGAKFTALLGLTILACGLALLIFSGPHSAYFPLLFVALTLVGTGAAMGFTPLLTMAVVHVPSKDAGIGSGIVNVSQQVAAALSVAVLGVAATSRTDSLLATGHSVIDALDAGYRVAFAIALACVVLGVVVGFFVLKNPRAQDDVQGVDADSLDPIAETMIAEVI